MKEQPYANGEVNVDINVAYQLTVKQCRGEVNADKSLIHQQWTSIEVIKYRM